MRDIIIVGLGPAAYTAALYCTRYKMSVTLIGGIPGGQVAVSGEIENYPGFESITGRELSQKMQAQVQANGAEIVFDTVDVIEKKDGTFVVRGQITGEHQGKMVLLATGTKHRLLGAKGEEEWYGKGVTYCATCDGMFYRGKKVAVVGAGNSAVEAALYLADLCPEVRVFVRKSYFRADQILLEKIEKRENIIVEFETEISEFLGNQKLEKVILGNGKTRELEGVFIEIGSDPETLLAKNLGCNLDPQNFIAVDAGQRTSVSGVLAAGDATTASEKFAQIATAVGEGAIAARSAFEIFQKG